MPHASVSDTRTSDADPRANHVVRVTLYPIDVRTIQDSGSILKSEVFEVDISLGITLSTGLEEPLDESIIVLSSYTWPSESEVQRIVQECLVVGSYI